MVAELSPALAAVDEIARLQAENAALRSRNAELERSLADADASVHARSSTTSRLDMEAEKVRLRERVAELEAAIPQVRRELALTKTAQKESQAAAADRDDAERDLRRWQIAGSWLEREHAKCEEQRAMLERHIERLEHLLAGRQRPDPDGLLVPPDELGALVRKASEADTLRRNFEYLLAAMVDKRFKPGMRATIAALVDIVGAPVPGSYSTPQRVYRDEIARRTGQSVDTVGDHLQDLKATSTAKVEPREVLKEREDEDGNKFLRPETELWVSLGPLPDRALSKEQVAALCQRAKADAERKRRCPRCGSKHLVAAAYRCQACGCTCTADEADEAGATMQERPSGTIAHAETGEVMHPGKPGLPFIPAHERGVDSTPRSNGHRGVEMTPPITLGTGAWIPRPGVSPPIDLHVPSEQPPAAEGGGHYQCSDCRRPIPKPAIGVGRCAPCRQRAYAEQEREDTS